LILMSEPAEQRTVDGVSCSRTGDVAVLRLQRPPVNALDPSLVGLLHAALEGLADDSSVGALVVTGGNDRFVAGGDLKAISAMSAVEFLDMIEGIKACFDAVEALPIPTIAAINGDALGGGLELALACDLRIADDDARLGLPEVRLGMLPGAGGTQRLTEIVGRGPALDLLLTGRAASADEALRIGLIDRVVPAGTVLDAAVSLASSLGGGPRDAHAAIKRCVGSFLRDSRADGMATETREVVRQLDNAEAREGFTAFFDKRKPDFASTRKASEQTSEDRTVR
jgi:enoyl-CoA hydratase